MKHSILLSSVAFIAAVGSVSTDASAAGCANSISNTVSCSGGGAIFGENTSNSGGDTAGVYGAINNGGLAGVYGENTSLSLSGHGVEGFTQAGWPSAGVYGTTPASGGEGVQGWNTNGISGGGGYFQGPTAGVQGYATYTNGVGASGVAGGSGGHGIDGICNNSCSSSNGWAGYFTGRVKVTSTINGSTTGSAPINGANTTLWAQTSDVRLKKNIKPLDGALNKLLQLRGVTYEWKDPERGRGLQRGFIAQEVETVLPEWVAENSDGLKTLTPKGLEAMLVESIRTLKTENDALKDRVKVLEDNRRPLRAGLGEGTLGFGALILLGGAFLLSRRSRSNTQS